MHRRTLSILILVALLLSALLSRAARPVRAASYIVTKFTDSNDGSCDAADCSLREAIIAANAAVDVDVITLAAGTYTLTLGGVDNTAAGGDLDIVNPLTLVGAGSGLTVIDAAGSPDGALALHSAGAVVIAGITIKNAHAGAFDAVACYGSQLALEDVIVRDSSSNDLGGGIFADQCDLSLQRCQITGNASSQGGGLYLLNSGSVHISRSLISGNTATQGGGGIFSQDSIVTLAESSLLANDAGANGAGGGIVQVGDIAMLVIEHSTIAGNHGALEGGGIYAPGGRSLTLRNSTVSANTTDRYGGGISTNVPTEMSYSTVAHNLADADGDGLGMGGGLFAGSDSAVTVRQSILGQNLLGDPAEPSDCARFGAGAVTSEGYNLIQAAGDLVGPGECTFTAAGDIRGRDPRLSPLADRGGETWTHGLLYGSPAIDAGTNVDCPAFDQRYGERPLDGDGDGVAVCDIGAFETARVWGVFLPLVLR